MLILFTILLAAQAATPATITPAQITPVQIEVTPARRVAILPWTMIGGVEEAQDIAKKAVLKMFESTNYTVISATDAKRVWEEDMHMPRLAADSERESEAPPMPTPEQLLAFESRLGMFRKRKVAYKERLDFVRPKNQSGLHGQRLANRCRQ